MTLVASPAAPRGPKPSERWFETHLVSSRTAQTPAEDFWKSYKAYCHANGVERDLTRKDLDEAMDKQGYPLVGKALRHGVRVRLSLNLRTGAIVANWRDRTEHLMPEGFWDRPYWHDPDYLAFKSWLATGRVELMEYSHLLVNPNLEGVTARPQVRASEFRNRLLASRQQETLNSSRVKAVESDIKPVGDRQGGFVFRFPIFGWVVHFSISLGASHAQESLSPGGAQPRRPDEGSAPSGSEKTPEVGQ